MEAIFRIKPAFIISPIFICPELNTIAFGGVATGSIKAQEAASTAPAISMSGAILKEAARVINKGRIMLAVAVLDVISVRKFMPATTASKRITDGNALKFRNWLPSHPDKSVEEN